MRIALFVAIIVALIIADFTFRPDQHRSGLASVLFVFLLGLLYSSIFASAENATSWGREKGESRFAFACRQLGRTLRRWRKSRYQWIEIEDESDAGKR
jgi:hypothetical protein